MRNGEALPADTISASLLNRILRAAVAKGASRSSLLASIGLDEARLRNPLNRMSSQIGLRTFRVLERHFVDPAISLTIGETAAPQNFSDIGFATRLSNNLATVIDANIQLQILRQNMVKTTFDPTAKPPTLVWSMISGEASELAAFTEFSVATFARLARQVLGEPPLLRRVDFQHAARFDPKQYEDAFGCPVHFSMTETKMEMTARQLFQALPDANPGLLAAAADRYAQPANWMADDKQHTAVSYFYLSNEIDKSPPTLDRMAASFGMTERTLRRKLVDEGHPFRELLDDVRRDLCALYFLENNRSYGEIALLLGYSDLSAFTRAHKRWHGVAPSKV